MNPVGFTRRLKRSEKAKDGDIVKTVEYLRLQLYLNILRHFSIQLDSASSECWEPLAQARTAVLPRRALVCIDQLNEMYWLFWQMAASVAAGVSLMTTADAPILGWFFKLSVGYQITFIPFWFLGSRDRMSYDDDDSFNRAFRAYQSRKVPFMSSSNAAVNAPSTALF